MGGLFTVGIVSPTTASANADGCHYFYPGSFHGVPIVNGQVCIDVDGNGDRLDEVTARAKFTPYISNGQLKISGYDRYNHLRGQFASHYYYGKHFGWMSYTYVFNAHFPELKGGRICSALFENGIALPGACESIY